MTRRVIQPRRGASELGDPVYDYRSGSCSHTRSALNVQISQYLSFKLERASRSLFQLGFASFSAPK